MWIRNTNEATRRLFDADLMSEPVEFASTGRAQVAADVGEALCDRYTDIEPADTAADTE